MEMFISPTIKKSKTYDNNSCFICPDASGASATYKTWIRNPSVDSISKIIETVSIRHNFVENEFSVLLRRTKDITAEHLFNEGIFSDKKCYAQLKF